MNTLLLAIDDTALPIKENLCYHLSKPAVRAEPVLMPSPRESKAPDNCAAMFYGTVLHDEGRFRMWYHACHWGMNPDWPPEVARQNAKNKDPFSMGPVCYAESDDGVHWSKPALRQVSFFGSLDNNAIDLPYIVNAGVNVIRDDVDPDPSRRYKMVYQFFPRFSDPPMPGTGKISTVATAISPDGLRWKHAGVPFVDRFIEPSSFYKHGGKYIIGYQAGDAWGSHFSEGGGPSGRVGLARYSLDFDHWIDGHVEALVLPEPRDPSNRGTKQRYDQNHLGVAAASYGKVCVGLYGLWHNQPEFHDISCDFGLAVSNDGLVFREPVKGHVFLASADSPATPHPTRSFDTNLCQANGILNVGNETRIYHGRWRNTGFHRVEDYHGEIALATLPRDRWGALALFPNRDRGWVWSEPFTVPRNPAITLNADGARGLSIELVDETFQPLPEFSGDHAAAVGDDSGLSLPVQWKASRFGGLSGNLIRLRILFQKTNGLDPRLFAVGITGS